MWLWKTLKFEMVYVRAYDTVSETKAHLALYVGFYNERRLHSSLDGRMPDHVCF